MTVTGREPEKDGSGRQAEELGAANYIHKPLQLDELEKVVMKLVKSAKGLAYLAKERDMKSKPSDYIDIDKAERKLKKGHTARSKKSTS